MSDQQPAATTSRSAAVWERIDEHVDGCPTCRRYLLDDDDWYQPCPVLDALHDEYDERDELRDALSGSRGES